MTASGVGPEDSASTWARWRVRVIGGAVVLVVLVITYLILAAFIPRWWAQRVGDTVGKSFSKGITFGLLYGCLGTLIPLLLLLAAVLLWRRRAGKFLAGAAAVLAILLAIPNLMTLSVVRGNGSAAEAGRQIMNVEAPAFRGATLAGFLIALALFLVVLFFTVRRQLRRRKAARAAVAGGAGTVPVAPATDTATTRPGEL